MNPRKGMRTSDRISSMCWSGPASLYDGRVATGSSAFATRRTTFATRATRAAALSACLVNLFPVLFSEPFVFLAHSAAYLSKKAVMRRWLSDDRLVVGCENGDLLLFDNTGEFKVCLLR